MQKTCVVTDSTAIFTSNDLPGKEHLYLIPHQIQVGGDIRSDSFDFEVFEKAVDNKDHPRVLPIPVDIFREKFQQLEEIYQDIIVILISSNLNPSMINAREAVANMKSSAPIHLIDSQTTATGLGLLVQAALKACDERMSGIETQRIVRGLTRNIYAIYCLPDLFYLYHTGLLDPAQAIVGEMLNMIPFFILESGKLIPVQKARSPRHMVDIMQEFIAEFDYLKSLNLIFGLPRFENESRNLKERISQYFPNIEFSEHQYGVALASILGPNSLGLVAVDESVGNI